MSLISKINEQYDKPAQQHKLHWWHIPLVLLLIAGTFYAASSYNGPKDNISSASIWKDNECQQVQGEVFGTIYHITYKYASPLDDSIKQVFAEVDHSLSPFNKESVITAINNNTSMKVDARFKEVFLLAKDISFQTNGAFDITVAPLVNAWGFGFKHMQDVNDSTIDSLLQFVGIDKVHLESDTIRKTDDRTMLDCSAIAKGYGVDAVGKYFESKGISNYMVEIGGEVRVRGTNPKGKEWRIGINKPVDDPTGSSSEIQQVLNVSNISMATSGNYRNFYEKDNKRYAHTIDPRTGHPVQHSILSSTVLADDCATADAYATSFMVLGLDEAKRVLQSHPELVAYFIYSVEGGETREWYSPRLQSLISNKKEK